MAKKSSTSKKKKVGGKFKTGKDNPSWKDHHVTNLHGLGKVKMNKAGQLVGNMTVKLRETKTDSESGPWPKDEASKHKYPPPKKHPLFRAKWISYIDTIVNREGFQPAHLDSLEVLCGLIVDEHDLSAFIRSHGQSYKSVSRFGETWKTYPEVASLHRARVLLNKYMGNLGLFPKKGKDLKVTDPDQPDEEKW